MVPTPFLGLKKVSLLLLVCISSSKRIGLKNCIFESSYHIIFPKKGKVITYYFIIINVPGIEFNVFTVNNPVIILQNMYLQKNLDYSSLKKCHIHNYRIIYHEKTYCTSQTKKHKF